MPRDQGHMLYRRAGNEEVLPLMYKVKGGEAFHLIALKAPVCGIVNLFEIGLVSERRIPGKPRYGSLGTVIPFTCKKHGKESVRRHGLWSSADKKMCQNEPNPESQIKGFRGFSSFRELRNAANGIFNSSQYWESRFSLIFCFPNVGKADFQRFLIFPRGGKPLFLVFRSSYPYESLFLPFFINCTPYLSDYKLKVYYANPNMKYDESNIAYNGQVNIVQNRKVSVKFNPEVGLPEN